MVVSHVRLTILNLVSLFMILIQINPLIF